MMETRDHQNTNIYSLNTNFAKSLPVNVYNVYFKTFIHDYIRTNMYGVNYCYNIPVG